MRRLYLFAVGCLLLLTGYGQFKSPVLFYRPTHLKDSLVKKMQLPKIIQPVSLGRMQKTTDNCTAVCTPLPVKWLDIKGERLNDSTALIKWETANEINNKGFDVERSFGNASNFGKAGYVQSSVGTTASARYQFRDRNDFTGISYYRLKQIDADGKYSYSKIVAVKGYRKEEFASVYPNPAQAELQLLLNLSKGGTTVLFLYDVNGHLLQQKQTVFTTGAVLFAWNVRTLASGTYLIRIFTPSENFLSAKFLKN
ncbi:T9SS type A sorting domain-containing protein [Flavisolibacter ginsenosidimutans]|uniref:T9SS type A sorting domain-containing protein n=1 Tax=Flavisolibacter ginsenosidimutans TaxID=661481 RepID=A0A5B8UJQ4_9BACT|nr:T9SS type A sorting domain-containing protein [Flavisolibacter ginsenosidimutans]QEC56941.1 T9SS type A sorting domain-containing protein [Flavisolibacter ginsenosidimutans]